MEIFAPELNDSVLMSTLPGTTLSSSMAQAASDSRREIKVATPPTVRRRVGRDVGEVGVAQPLERPPEGSVRAVGFLEHQKVGAERQCFDSRGAPSPKRRRVRDQRPRIPSADIEVAEQTKEIGRATGVTVTPAAHAALRSERR